MININHFTNKVKYTVNKHNILKDYDLIDFKINSSKTEKEFAQIWTLLKNSIEVISYYKSAANIYLLTQKREIYKVNQDDLENINCDMKLINEQSINKISPIILINILLGLNGTTGNMFSIGNFQNGCYLIHEIKANKVVTVKFSINKNDLIFINVVTFSKMKCTKKNSNKYIFYCIESNKLIRVTNPLELERDLYILKNTGKKSSIDFMNFEKEFLKSKVGYLAWFLERINARFSNYLSLKLEQESFIEYELKMNKEKKVQELKENIKNGLLKYKKINLVDYERKLNEEFKRELLLKFKDYFQNDLEVEFVDIIDKSIPTFIFLDEKDNYEKNDPYLDLKKENKLSQVISYTISKKIVQDKTIFEALIKELAIKNEIYQKNFYLSEKWESYYNYEFFLQIKEKEENTFKKIIIEKNQISFSNLNLFDQLKINKIIDLKNNHENIELIAFKNDDYFIVTRTKEFILPDTTKCLEVYNEFIKNDDTPRLRRKDYKNFTSGGSGINYKLDKNSLTYFTTLNTKNLNVKISRANIIRKVYFNDSAKFDCINFLDSLDEYFIRNKELTVLPFIVKYLNEYLKMEHIKINF